MFERYTEKARRVIFFARYEASQFGTPEIGTEYLLLGMMREAPEIFLTALQTPIDADLLRARIRQSIGTRDPIPTSVDLPLTNASKRVLAYAADEAESLHHKHIGAEHLFMGLLREEETLAALVLREHGASLKNLRRSIEHGRSPNEGSEGRSSLRGWASGSVCADLAPKVHLVGEDGSGIEVVSWNPLLSRMPLIGESVEFEQDGHKVTYRILDVVWQVVKSTGLPSSWRGLILPPRPCPKSEKIGI